MANGLYGWLMTPQGRSITNEDGTYTLTYGEAVDLGYCRPVTFHKHEGRFTVDLDGGESVEVASHEPAALIQGSLKRIPGPSERLGLLSACLHPAI